MVREVGNSLASTADSIRAEGRFTDAAEYYSRAAFECFGDGVSAPYGITTSFGEQYLLESATCHLISGNQNRLENRAKIGILVAEDVLNRECDQRLTSAYDQARRGAWYEFIGDFRLLRGDDPSRSYDQARNMYQKFGDPPASLAEQEHLNLFAFYRSVLRIADGDPMVQQETIDEGSLCEWVDHKESTLPESIEDVREMESKNS
ncbi:hypothetical protein ACAH01_02135 [Halomicrobium sp. HM KBTZ05]|uniref:hypothetical protein n=1 Tax=Halomicrobium sp. HM KBTZ05 TaxID=3242663 RepID=UPI003555D78D